ncbi:hypothetical protein [Neorhodopirellula lusitana]|uniref:hypothetical protein n=1 Tax=Neorhodopirellula lusitana TaxID=445327 RepID=UPI00384FFA13
MKSNALTLFLLLIATPVVAQAPIEIDPARATGATVQYFGWDLKGWKDSTSTPKRAEKLYADTPANIVRISIEGIAHREDGTVNEKPYGAMLKSIANIREINPDVKIFASIKLAKEKTFPAWVQSNEEGSIFNVKVKRPIPQKYARLVADYIDWLRKNKIAIDFLGLNNEISNALTPPLYVATARALTAELDRRNTPKEYRSFQFVGAEGFGTTTSVRYAQAIVAEGGLAYANIWGSHFYPDLTSGSINDWTRLSNVARGRPIWHTELHVRSSPEPAEHVAKVRDGLAILFATNQIGAEGYVWWSRGHDDNPTNLVRRKAITSLLGGSCVYTSGQYKAKDNAPDATLAQATRVDDIVWLWYFNPVAAIKELPIHLKRGKATQASCEFWGGGGSGPTQTSGTLEVENRNGKYLVVKDIPATSIVLVKMDLRSSSSSSPDSPDALVAPRQWRSANPNSKAILAALESVKDGIGHFRQASGATFDYPLNKLSTEDRQIAEAAASQ